MRAITLHAPWATLLVTRQACDLSAVTLGPDGCRHPMVKRFETRSWPCPPSIIGQRVAFHQGKQKPGKVWDDRPLHVGEYVVDCVPLDPPTWCLSRPSADEWGAIDLPLGAVVGSGIVTASLPIVAEDEGTPDGWPIEWPLIERAGDELRLFPHGDDPAEGGETDISDQLPYGDWTPGRWAWRIEDAAPTTERCPWCWGRGYHDTDDGIHSVPCPCCDRVGFCDPIPAVGRQGWFEWSAC